MIVLLFLHFLLDDLLAQNRLSIIFSCLPEPECEAISKTMPEYLQPEHSTGIKKFIEHHLISHSRMIETLTYETRETILYIKTKLRSKYEQIIFEGLEQSDQEMLRSLLNSRLDSVYSDSDREIIISEVTSYLNDKGWRGIKIEVFPMKDNNLRIKVEVGAKIFIRSVEVTPGNLDIPAVAALTKIRGAELNLLNLKLLVSDISQELFKEGYFFNNVSFDIVQSSNQADLLFKIDLGRRTVLYFENIDIASRKEMNEIAWSIMRSDTGTSAINRIKDEIEGLYFSRGFFDTEVEIQRNVGKSKNGEEVEIFILSARAGARARIKTIEYEGVEAQLNSQLENFLEGEATPLVARGYYDPIFFTNHRSEILKFLISKGFLDATVKGPFHSIQDSKIQYRINLGGQYFVRNIFIKGTDGAEIKESNVEHIRSLMGLAYNKREVDELVKNAIISYQNEGFYYANLKNENDGPARFDNFNVDIHLVLDKGKLTVFDGINLTGLNKTKEKVVGREIALNAGDVLTPDKIKEINDNLLNLGLFSYVRISPFIDRELQNEYRAKISIQVQEKDRKIVRVSPGYRTDIGYKIGGSYQYNNLKGMNESITFSGIINRRTSFSNLDERRQAAGENIFEGSLSTEYQLPYIGDYKIRLSNTLEASRRRFYGFDADIFRAGFKTTKDVTKNLSLSLLYQLEVISQYDATNSIDEGYFRIGGFTPSIVYDFRDSIVNPRKGGLSSLVVEYARPEFLLSTLNKDPEIYFYKMLLRQVLYKSFGPVTFAASGTFGVQENLSKEKVYDSSGNVLRDSQGRPVTKGYIPNIKVFRLEGINTVRGFADNEINRLESGLDISQVAIRDKAYLSNLKIESRYNMQDSLVWTLFVDAGRVSADSYNFGDLRTSVGTGFKFLTPVGTLDFDYGVKLKREYDSASRRESLGRFHLSIGFF
jgi:outer membrane protein insertion porin family